VDDRRPCRPPTRQPPDSATPSPYVPGAYTGPNFWLLSNWRGAPSTIVPQGAAVQSHLAANGCIRFVSINQGMDVEAGCVQGREWPNSSYCRKQDLK